MNILICGAGQVGYNIARQLAREENEITLIDQDAELIRDINEHLDVRAFQGHAAHPSDLEDAGIADIDMLIAVTHSDEVNMVACQIAHSLFNVPVKIARVRHQDYLRTKWKTLYSQDNLPIDFIISPEREVAEAIHRRMHVPGALDTMNFFDGEVTVLAVKCDETCPLIKLPFNIITQRLQKLELTMLGVVSSQRFTLPRPNMILNEGDIAYVLTKTSEVRQVLSAFGHNEREAQRIVIVGGGNIGLYIAQMLESENPECRIKLIEYSRDRAENIANKLSRTTVIHGSGLERSILIECDIENAETIIGVTNDDKVNILSALLAKRLGCERSVTLVNNGNLMPMLGNLGVDVLVNPRETTASSILQHVRRGKIRSIYTILDGAAEIIEAVAIETSPLVGRSIDNLKLPKGVLLGAVMRNNKLQELNEELIIHEEDRIVLLSMAESVKRVEQFFSVSLEYF
jgi:trk system potassium uptake protein TrkA